MDHSAESPPGPPLDPLCLIAAWLVAWSALVVPAACQQPPPDATWETDATLDVERSITDLGLGAVQGVVVRDGRVYAFGDVFQAKPRVGVIREYTSELKPTGRVVWLRKGGKPLIVHPTGLTWHDRWGTFLGDTVKSADPTRSRGVIYRIDWERAWKDGNLDEAVLNVIDDDAAINGCRPEFVSVGGRSLLATADYGDIRPEIRLYDPEGLLGGRPIKRAGRGRPPRPVRAVQSEPALGCRVRAPDLHPERGRRPRLAARRAGPRPRHRRRPCRWARGASAPVDLPPTRRAGRVLAAGQPAGAVRSRPAQR